MEKIKQHAKKISAAFFFILTASIVSAQENIEQALNELQPVEIKVEGQIEKSVIDPVSATIYIPLPYYIDGTSTVFPISKAKVVSVELQEGLTHTLPDEIDLRYKTNFIISSSENEKSKTWTISGGYQIPGSDFSQWHSEEVPGFITLGNVECKEIPGTSAQSLWDNGNPAFSTSGSKKWPTYKITLPDGSTAAQLTTRRVFGVIASGNLFTGKIERNMTLKQLLGFTNKNGKALIDWGIPFEAVPKGFTIKFNYDGKGDECSLAATLENRNNDIRLIVGAAGYIGTAETSLTGPTLSISEPDSNGMRTLTSFFVYDEDELAASPIISEEDVIGESGLPVTHINVVFASSVNGDEFEGKKDATLTIKDFELIY